VAPVPDPREGVGGGETLKLGVGDPERPVGLFGEVPGLAQFELMTFPLADVPRHPQELAETTVRTHQREDHDIAPDGGPILTPILQLPPKGLQGETGQDPGV
jgi:hypothetical protein